MPEAAVPLVAEGAVAGTMTAAEIAAAEAAAAQAAAAAEAAAAAQAATNASVLSTITATPVSSAAGATAAGAGTGAGGAGGISSLVNTTGGPTTWEQIFSQGQNLAEGSTELGKLASTASELPALPEAITGPAIPPSAGPVTAPIPGTSPAAPPPIAPPPPAPPPPPEVIPRSVGPIDTTTNMANPGFDTGGFETRNGLDILAKEVGAMPGVQPTISAYGAGPIGSTLPTAFNPAAPGIDQLVQTNLSSMGSNIPSGGTPLYPQAVTAQVPSVPSAMNEVITPNGTPLYPQAVTPQTPVVQSAMNEVAGGQPTPFEYVNNTAYGSSLTGTPTATPEVGGLQGLFNEFKAMPLKDKALTGLMASSAYQMMNQPKPYEKEKYKSTFKPGLYSGYQPVQPTPYQPQYAHGGLADLGGYSDGGRMLKGPGDGMSDDIPATIANKQPARLANEEFVVPADVVSHLGNGSSEAGAKVLYKMMDRVRQARTGHKKQGKQINPEKYLA